MTLSVIVPVYNAEKYMDKCIESLVNQTYKDLEIILVNDGSTDNSGTKCDEWAAKDSRIKVIHKQNGGVSSARNAGLDAANGEYVAFADTNSAFDGEAFAKCAAEIENHNPDLLVSAIEADAEDNRATYYMDCNMYTRSECTENIARYINTGIGFAHIYNKIFSMRIIRTLNMHFNEDMPLVADQLFNCRFFAATGHIRCVSLLLCSHSADGLMPIEGTDDYLRQGKEYSQKLIDAVQSKGLYGAASQAIGENYQKILYKHLVLLSLPNKNLPDSARAAALQQLSQSPDSAPLMVYLSTMHGIKSKYIYQLFKLRQWKLLLAFLGK